MNSESDDFYQLMFYKNKESQKELEIENDEEQIIIEEPDF